MPPVKKKNAVTMFIIGEKCRATTFELKIAIFGCARKRHVKAAHINDAQEGSISAIHVYVHLLDYIYFLDHGEEKKYSVSAVTIL